MITYVNPAVAVLFGVLLLDEDFTLGMGVGFPLILVGSVLAARRRVALAPAVPEAVHLRGGRAISRCAPARTRVSNTAATTPVPSSDGSTQSTSMPSSGCSADVPR